MKDKQPSRYLISALFAFVLSVCATGNLITGYALPVESLGKLHLWCGLFAVATAMLFRFRHGGKVIFVAFWLALAVLWRKTDLLQQVQTISYIITSHYHRVYGWPILGDVAATDVSLPLILLAALAAAGVNLHICRGKHILTAFLPVVLPLVLCLVTIDKAPATTYLYLMFLGLTTLLITDWTRRHSPGQGMALVLRSFIPIAVFLAMLFYLNPRDAYVNRAGELQQEVMSWFQQFRESAESVLSGAPLETGAMEQLNLRYVGPKSRISHSVMRINAPIDGIVYLRGRDYDEYSGTGWTASANRTEAFPEGGASAGRLSIVTYGVRDVLYVPYYASERITLSGGALANEKNIQQYSYALSGTSAGTAETPGAAYTKLPEQTRQWAEKLAEEITRGSVSDRNTVLLIGNYVRSSAVYDLSTLRMDPQQEDFARWFLEESETGYCVHFATAATVLLRASAIPARYVEGYMVTCKGGEDVVVTNRHAHAWAEYYDSVSGTWRILEATPADPEEYGEETAPATSQTEEPTSVPESTSPQINPTKPSANRDETTYNPTKDSENSPTQDAEKKPFRIPTWLKTLFVYLLLAACVPLQGELRIRRKQALWNRGRPNQMALTRWRETRRIAKVLRQPYPEKLDDLAQKAKFSQHRIQPEELKQFDAYRQTLRQLISGRPWYQRFFSRWILAVD